MQDFELIASEFGNIDNEGNLKIYNREHFLARLKRHKSVNIEFMVIKRNGKFTNSMRAYYFTVIVPEIKKALEYTGVRISRGETDYLLREKFLYNETYDPEKDEWTREPCRLNDNESQVTFERFVDYMDECIRFAAINLEWSVPYPNEIFKRTDYTDKQIQYALGKR